MLNNKNVKIVKKLNFIANYFGKYITFLFALFLICLIYMLFIHLFERQTAQYIFDAIIMLIFFSIMYISIHKSYFNLIKNIINNDKKPKNKKKEEYLLGFTRTVNKYYKIIKMIIILFIILFIAIEIKESYMGNYVKVIGMAINIISFVLIMDLFTTLNKLHEYLLKCK